MYKTIVSNDKELLLEKGSVATGWPLILLGIVVFFIPRFGIDPEIIPFPISLVSVAIVFVGLLIVVFSSKYTLSFNKSDNLFKIQSRSLYRKAAKQYTISSIKELMVNREITGSESRGGEIMSFKIVICMQNGEQIELNNDGSVTTRGAGFLVKASTKSSELQTAEQIATFLRIPMVKNF